MKSVNVPPMSTPTTRMNHLTSFPEQLTEGARENAHTELDVFRGAVFVGRMADAAPARNEDHRGGRATADEHRVVSGATRHPEQGRTLGDCCALDEVDQRRVQLQRLQSERLLELDLQPFLSRDPGHDLLDELLELGHPRRCGRSD